MESSIKTGEKKRDSLRKSEQKELDSVNEEIDKLDKKMDKAADKGKTDKYAEYEKERAEKVKRKEELETILNGTS